MLRLVTAPSSLTLCSRASVLWGSVPRSFSSDTAPDENTKRPPVQCEDSPPQVLVNCLRNNIFLTVSRPPGNILFKLSGGSAGFSGAQKTSQKSALAMLDTLQEKLAELNFSAVRLNFRGINSARSVIVSQLRRLGIRVTEVIDTTGVPFNGCRPPKARRL